MRKSYFGKSAGWLGAPLIFILTTVLSSCGVDQEAATTSPIPTSETKTTETKPELDHKNFLLNAGLTNKLLDNCKENRVTINSTPYGTWEKHTKCKFSLSGSTFVNQDIEIHRNSSTSAINAVSLMVFPDTENGQKLAARYSSGIVYQGENTCTRYGRRIIPILIIADKSLCDALAYSLI